MSAEFYVESLKGRDHAEDLHVYGRIILKISEIVWKGLNSIYWAQDRGQWWVLVSVVMNVPVP
jgi:hypothetical protein